ncbi:MAG: hypothetical protein HW400_247 [Candidatus Levybacteria bacterium]|nr:hypothetical protein [Candidatus Levybacteria bacterium]
MEEALRRAAAKNPNSPIVPEINKAIRDQEARAFNQREEKRFTQLKEEYSNLGRMWYETDINPFAGLRSWRDSTPLEQTKKQWTQALASLKDKLPEQRIELLGAMAFRMQLDKRISEAYRESLLQVLLSNPFDSLNLILAGISMTLPSSLFMNAVSDMLDHSEEEKQEFKDFIREKSGLKGKIDLPQLFLGISRWLEQDAPKLPRHD